MNIDARLAQVRAIIEERQNDYGNPKHMFKEIAERWDTDRRHVALQMADLKLARLSKGSWSDDSAIDAIAYLLFALEFDD